jgi:Tfp pilus assembly protein PilW
MELIWAMALGMIILLAAFTVIDRAFKGHKTIIDRQDSLQRGRNVLELMTRQLRSQVCVQTSPVTMPLATAGDNTITFYAYLGDPTTATSANRDPGTGQIYPEQHTLTWASNTITETDAKVTSFAPLTVAAPYRTTTLLTNVLLPANSKLFQYSSGSIDTSTLSPTPLSVVNRNSVKEVSVGFKVLPTGITDPNNKQATTFQDYVFWRSVDPLDPTQQPCDTG